MLPNLCSNFGQAHKNWALYGLRHHYVLAILCSYRIQLHKIRPSLVVRHLLRL